MRVGSVLMAAILVVINVTLILINTSGLASKTAKLTHQFSISRVIVKLAIITFKASLPRFMADFVSTLGNDDSVSVNGIIKDGVFGILTVINYSTLIAPVIVDGSAVQGSVPFTVLTALILVVVTVSGIIGKKKRGLLSHSSKLMVLNCFNIFVFCAFFVTRGGRRRGKMRARVNIRVVPVPC